VVDSTNKLKRALISVLQSAAKFPGGAMAARALSNSEFSMDEFMVCGSTY
jgi:hypothetical protein